MLQLVNLFQSNFLKVESPEPVVSKLTRYISIVASDSENEPQPSVTREKRKRREILETTIATASAKGLDPLPVDILKILNSNIATEGFNVKLVIIFFYNLSNQKIMIQSEEMNGLMTKSSTFMENYWNFGQTV